MTFPDAGSSGYGEVSDSDSLIKLVPIRTASLGYVYVQQVGVHSVITHCIAVKDSTLNNSGVCYDQPFAPRSLCTRRNRNRKSLAAPQPVTRRAEFRGVLVNLIVAHLAKKFLAL